MIRESSDNLYNSKTKFIIIFLTFDNIASHKKCIQFTKAYRGYNYRVTYITSRSSRCLQAASCEGSLPAPVFLLMDLLVTHFFENWLRTSTKSISILLDSGHVSNFSF